MNITTNTHIELSEAQPIQSFFSDIHSFYGISIRIQTSQQNIVALVDLEQVDKALRYRERNILEQILSTAEQRYFSRFQYPKRRREWLGGRIAAKAALLMLTEQGKQAWQLSILPDEYGRPAVDGLTERPEELLAISISHSNSHAASLAVRGKSCGIDLQEISSKLSSLTKHFAADSELELLARWPELGDQATGLTMLWAAKESLKKSMLYNQAIIFSGTEAERITAVREHVWRFDCAVQGHLPQTAMVYNLSPYILSLTQADSHA